MLYQKHRPKTLKEVHGNRLTVEAIESLTEIPHAMLFTGNSGTGKTTLARIIAKDILKCDDMDLKELNIADFRGIDAARDILRQITYKPVAGAVRVWILDEIGAATKDFQQSILKALEDTPVHTYFMLCTTDPQKLLKTIVTRCTEFRMTTLAERPMIKLLKEITQKENKEVAENVIELIAKECLGSARSALVALEKIIDLDAAKQLKAVEKAMSEENQVIDLCRILLKDSKWESVATILRGLQEQEAESVRRAVLGYCNAVLLKSDHAKAAAIIFEFQYEVFNSGWPSLTAACYRLSLTKF